MGHDAGFTWTASAVTLTSPCFSDTTRCHVCCVKRVVISSRPWRRVVARVCEESNDCQVSHRVETTHLAHGFNHLKEGGRGGAFYRVIPASFPRNARRLSAQELEIQALKRELAQRGGSPRVRVLRETKQLTVASIGE